MRRPVKNRNIARPDVRYQSERVSKFVNTIMWDGKKNAARTAVYRAFDEIKAGGADPLEVFETALRNAGPSVEVRSRRVGGANYQVPREVRPERKQALAMRWIRDAVRNKKGAKAYKALAEELLAASRNEGSAVKKKEDVHKMAEANRAFAHFAW
jgi:small subunit ribosomal protein S7